MVVEYNIGLQDEGQSALEAAAQKQGENESDTDMPEEPLATSNADQVWRNLSYCVLMYHALSQHVMS